MTTIRQDAWSTDEDLILAEVVLRHIREGSTQLAAFEEVGDRLSRTSAACGFRWNSAIRKKYESAIGLAKKQRAKGRALTGDFIPKEVKKEKSEENILAPVVDDVKGEIAHAAELNSNDSLTMDKVIEFLSGYPKVDKSQEYTNQIKRLEEENEMLVKRVEKLENEKKIIAEDYKALIGIMDRARQFSVYDHSTKSVAQSTK
ncbi:RsfA family transcriptional regulator [Alkalihalophilus lindianensis]|uniref:RsfA family transcriptional regulator n=1 Tax=Alkalihalophilus lindianensis TaxID=1630542 RepID=A0ABU3XBR3_9BACI|nr:RsfA family transcriptional regulator [Alkalihalophilus lindianensis]MDV2685321.1 RsfA family transcriptional regulator [Alkalihalophilus lindianensis]